MTGPKPVALPLGYSPIFNKKGDRWGSNPRVPEPQSGALTASPRSPYLTKKDNSGGGDRTHDLTGMNRTLSPAELRRHLAPQVGFEPTTDRLTADCSTTELLWNNC